MEKIEKLLDKKFDEVNQRLDGVDKRLDGVDKRLDGLDKNIYKLTSEVRAIQNFIKIESTGIENEINKNVKKFISDKFEGSIIKKFILKNVVDFETGEDITELDGVFLISYKNYPSYKKANDKIEKNSSLAIIEAKHHVNVTQINEKLIQIYRIKKYLDNLKRFNDDNDIYKYTFDAIASRKFKKTISHLSLHNLSDDILFFIGGPTWEDRSVKYCEDLNNGLITEIKGFSLSIEEQKEILEYIKHKIYTVVPNGSKYQINDFSHHQLRLDNYIGEDQMLLQQPKTLESIKEERTISYRGGKKIVKIVGAKSIGFEGYEMEFMPNFLNIKYT